MFYRLDIRAYPESYSCEIVYNFRYAGYYSYNTHCHHGDMPPTGVETGSTAVELARPHVTERRTPTRLLLHWPSCVQCGARTRVQQWPECAHNDARLFERETYQCGIPALYGFASTRAQSNVGRNFSCTHPDRAGTTKVTGRGPPLAGPAARRP